MPQLASWDFPRDLLGVRLLVAAGVERGLSPQECLAGSDVEPSHVDLPGTVEAWQELKVASTLVERLGDEPGLGVRASRDITPSSIGALGFALVTSPTYAAAAEQALDHVQLSQIFSRPELVVEDEVTLLLHDDDLPRDLRDFLVERELAAIIVVIGQILGEQAPSLRISTDLSAPRRAALQSLSTRWEVVEGTGTTTISADRDVLERRLPLGDPELSRVLWRECAAVLSRRGRSTQLVPRLRSWLSERPGAAVTVAQAAAHFHLEPRTLHRRLTAEGTTFRRLRNEVNEAVATQWLTVDGLAVAEVARRLGYADPTSFHHAYRRWTGRAPGSARG